MSETPKRPRGRPRTGRAMSPRERLERLERRAWDAAAAGDFSDMSDSGMASVFDRALRERERERLAAVCAAALARMPARESIPSPAPDASPPDARDSLRATVRALRDAGLSWRAIAAKLTADGVPTRSGRGAHDPGTLRKLLIEKPEREQHADT